MGREADPSVECVWMVPSESCVRSVLATSLPALPIGMRCSSSTVASCHTSCLGGVPHL